MFLPNTLRMRLVELAPPVIAWKARRGLRLVIGGLRSLFRRGFGATLATIIERRQAAAEPPRTDAVVIAPAKPDGTRIVLVIDAMMPDSARDSGSLRLLEILRIFGEQGFALAFMPDSGRATPGEIATLAAAGVELLGVAGRPNLPSWLQANAQRLTAAMLCRHYVAQQHRTLVRHYAPGATLMLDTVDLHFLREQRTAELADDRKGLAAARRTRRRELRQIRAADVTFVVSQPEQQ